MPGKSKDNRESHMHSVVHTEVLGLSNLASRYGPFLGRLRCLQWLLKGFPFIPSLSIRKTCYLHTHMWDSTEF
jgi:hypothetical protein